MASTVDTSETSCAVFALIITCRQLSHGDSGPRGLSEENWGVGGGYARAISIIDGIALILDRAEKHGCVSFAGRLQWLRLFCIPVVWGGSCMYPPRARRYFPAEYPEYFGFYPHGKRQCCVHLGLSSRRSYPLLVPLGELHSMVVPGRVGAALLLHGLVIVGEVAVQSTACFRVLGCGFSNFVDLDHCLNTTPSTVILSPTGTPFSDCMHIFC